MTREERRAYIDDVLMYNEASRARIREILAELRRDEGVMIDITTELREVYEIIMRSDTAARMAR